MFGMALQSEMSSTDKFVNAGGPLRVTRRLTAHGSQRGSCRSCLEPRGKPVVY